MNRKFTQFVGHIREDRSLCRARATALTRVLAPASIASQLKSTRDIKLIPAHAEELITFFERQLFGADTETPPDASIMSSKYRLNLLVQKSNLRYALPAMAEAYFTPGIHAAGPPIEESVQIEFMRRIARIIEPIQTPPEGWPTTVAQLHAQIREQMTAMKPGKKILDLVEPIITSEWFMRQRRSVSAHQLLDYVKEQLTPNLQAAL